MLVFLYLFFENTRVLYNNGIDCLLAFHLVKFSNYITILLGHSLELYAFYHYFYPPLNDQST